MDKQRGIGFWDINNIEMERFGTGLLVTPAGVAYRQEKARSFQYD
jgi:hypothetical protein